MYGFQENSATGVIRGLVDGLSVPSSLTPFQTDFSTKYGTGQCPEEGEEIGYDTVKFGFDYVSGCGISLNRSSLINMCCQGATSCLSSGTVSTITSPSKYSNANGVPFLFNFSDGYIFPYCRW